MQVRMRQAPGGAIRYGGGTVTSLPCRGARSLFSTGEIPMRYISCAILIAALAGCGDEARIAQPPEVPASLKPAANYDIVKLPSLGGTSRGMGINNEAPAGAALARHVSSGGPSSPACRRRGEFACAAGPGGAVASLAGLRRHSPAASPRGLKAALSASSTQLLVGREGEELLRCFVKYQVVEQLR